MNDRTELVLAMQFNGDSSPPVYLELKSIGLADQKTGRLSQLLGNFIEEMLGIPLQRVYIVFENVKRYMWGWNRTTF